VAITSGAASLDGGKDGGSVYSCGGENHATGYRASLSTGTECNAPVPQRCGGRLHRM